MEREGISIVHPAKFIMIGEALANSDLILTGASLELVQP